MLLQAGTYAFVLLLFARGFTHSNPMAKLAQDAQNAARMGQWAEDLKVRAGLVSENRGH
jgi:hypothetical protein